MTSRAHAAPQLPWPHPETRPRLDWGLETQITPSLTTAVRPSKSLLGQCVCTSAFIWLRRLPTPCACCVFSSSPSLTSLGSDVASVVQRFNPRPRGHTPVSASTPGGTSCALDQHEPHHVVPRLASPTPTPRRREPVEGLCTALAQVLRKLVQVHVC